MTTITIPSETFNQMREALEALLKRDKRNTCQHTETRLGGVIWEICEGCGMKWADDRGGKPRWKNPTEWDAAEAALSAAKAVVPQAQYSIDADPQGIRARVVSAVVGAMAYGASNTNKPPEGHWLNELWDIARVDANRVQPQPFGWFKQSELDQAKRFGGSINLWLEKYDCDKPVFSHPQASEPAWLPIETAPKDGSEVLMGNKDGSMTVGFYNKKSKVWCGDCPCSWATHWMPLPAAPEATK